MSVQDEQFNQQVNEVAKPLTEMTDKERKEFEKQLKKLQKSMQPTYKNAPKKMAAAIERIMELELRLGDLVRACEIASITKQFDILEGFVKDADTSLQTKIEVEYPQSGKPMKITVITNEEDAKA